MTTGQVYFVECAGRIKIGHSRNVQDRMKGLQTGAPEPLNLLCVVDGSSHFERAIHRHLKEFRVTGEWFRDCAEVRSLLECVVELGPEAIKFREPQRKPKPKSIALADFEPFTAFGISMKPIYARLTACIDRYYGEDVTRAVNHEAATGLAPGSLVNDMIGAFYSRERSLVGIKMSQHTIECLDALTAIMQDAAVSRGDFSRSSYRESAIKYVNRLEDGLNFLFKNPDVSVVDASAYRNVTIETADLA